LLGFAVAMAIRFSGKLDSVMLGDLIKWGPGMVLFLAAGATLGGILGGLAGMLGKRQVASTPERFTK
jgi:hypothetical protein